MHLLEASILATELDLVATVKNGKEVHFTNDAEFLYVFQYGDLVKLSKEEAEMFLLGDLANHSASLPEEDLGAAIREDMGDHEGDLNDENHSSEPEQLALNEPEQLAMNQQADDVIGEIQKPGKKLKGKSPMRKLTGVG